MEHDFDITPIPTLVIRLGIPAMFAQFFNILYSIVDRAFVGHIPGAGELALAGVGICAPVFTAVTAFSALAGGGGAALMSICTGRRDMKTARLAMNNAFLFLLAASLTVAVVSYLFERPLLFALGSSEAIYPYASGYFKIYMAGTAACLIGTGMNSFVMAFGQAKRAMSAVILGALVNTLLDPLFIFVFHMGINGAALATVIAQLCVMACVLGYLFSEKPPFRLSLTPPSAPVLSEITRIGSLPFFYVLFDNLLIISLNFTLRRFGGETLGDRYISCAAVVQSFMALVFNPAQGITNGCAALYSYHYGARHFEKSKQVFLYVFYLCAAYMLLLLLAAQLIPEVFARIFVRDKEMIKLCAACISKYTLGLIGVAAQYAIVNGLTSMGQIRSAMPISFFRKILYIVCVFSLPLFFPLDAVFYAESISDILGAGFTVLLFTCSILPGLRLKMTAAQAIPGLGTPQAGPL